MSLAVATFYGTASSKVELISGNPLVNFLAVSNTLYVGGNAVVPGTNLAVAGYVNSSGLAGSVPTLVASSSANGFADAGGTGYADATGQSMAYASFAVINNSAAKIDYTLHFTGQATAGGTADTGFDLFYIDSAFVLNKNSVPQWTGSWVWSQPGPGVQDLDTGLVEFDINGSLFAGQTATWSIQTTVNGYAQSNPVPEPSSMALLALGGAAAVRRFRRK